MITVHYKPLDALRPVHIAVMAAAEAKLSPSQLPTIFGLPELVLQHASDDLVEWGLAHFINDQVLLLPGGARCVSVWVDTDQRGFWSFPDPEGWILGKGVFFFRSPLSRLNDAGLDPATGRVISQGEAFAIHDAFQRGAAEFEQVIQNDAACRDLKSCFASGTDPSEMIESWFGRPKTRQHLNQLGRSMREVVDFRREDGTSNMQRAEDALCFIKKQQEAAEWRLRDEQKTLQLVRDVLMAQWLSERSGLLLELSESNPCSILIRSNCDTPSQEL